MKQDILLEPSSVKQIRVDKCTVRVIIDSDAFDAIADEWTALAEASDTTIFQSFEWNRSWWKHFGHGSELFIVVIFKRNEPVAIFPLFKDKIKWGGITFYSCYRFIGSNKYQAKPLKMYGIIPYTDYLDAIIHPKYRAVILRWLARKIQQKPFNSDEVLLESVCKDSSLWRCLPEELSKRNCTVTQKLTTKSYQVATTQPWEYFLKAQSSSRRKKLRRDLAQLDPDNQRNVFAITKVTDEASFKKYYQTMVLLHQQRWNRLGVLGTFYEEHNNAFHEEVLFRLFKKGWANLYLITSKNHPQKIEAIDLNLNFASHIYALHTAINDQSELYTKSPGKVLEYYVLKEAMDDKETTEYDYLRGLEEYKMSLSNQQKSIGSIEISKSEGLKKTFFNLVKKSAVVNRKLQREKAHLTFNIKQAGIYQGFRMYLLLKKGVFYK